MSEFTTVFNAFAERVSDDPDRDFMHQPLQGGIQTWTRAQTLDAAQRLAGALLGLGLAKGDKVALLSKNCAEWVVSDLAIGLAGLISVPIFPTAGPGTVAFVLDDSGARAVIIGKLDDPELPVPAISGSIITIGLQYESMDCQHDWRQLIDQAEPVEELPTPDSDDPMTILYTSGSTGKPKGVVISYGSHAYASHTSADSMAVTERDRTLSYLPMAHITERTVLAGPCLCTGAEMYFVDSLATFREDLLRSRATLFLSVPRLWVRFQSGVHEQIPPARLKLMLKLPILGSIIARKVRRGLGLEYCRLVGSGTAPISQSTLQWYLSIGVQISEGWGMSETSGLSCTNMPFRRQRLGTIGAPIRGTEMKLSDEGEILVRSPGLFSRYHRQPVLTAESFTDDGFFRTGDRAVWDEQLDAFRITGRVKDIFKSAKGKYVSPVPIESKLAANPLIEQVCVMGSGLRAPVAVVVLSAAATEPRERVAENLEKTLDAVNATLDSHERLSNIYVADEEWTIENGLLTPTLKFKRDQIESRYVDSIKELGRERVVWAGNE